MDYHACQVWMPPSFYLRHNWRLQIWQDPLCSPVSREEGSVWCFNYSLWSNHIHDGHLPQWDSFHLWWYGVADQSSSSWMPSYRWDFCQLFWYVWACIWWRAFLDRGQEDHYTRHYSLQLGPFALYDNWGAWLWKGTPLGLSFLTYFTGGYLFETSSLRLHLFFMLILE